MYSNKNIILIGLFTIIGFLSCQKSTIDKSTDTKNLSSAIRKSINSPNLKALKRSYSLLNVEEKQALWDTKWQTILKNDADKLTAEQVAIITSIKNFVDEKTVKELFKDPTDGEVFIENNLNYFEKHFSKSQIFLLIECPYFCDDFSIFKATNYLNELTSDFVVPNDDGDNCTCRYSIYCSIGGGGGGTCEKDNNCTQVAECGMTGSSKCTGKCK